MTLQELRDAFVAEHKLECAKRKSDFIKIDEHLIALWISEAQQNILERIKPNIVYKDIALLPNTYLYDLSDDYGRYDRAELNGEKIDIVSINDITTTGTISSGALSRIAIYYNGTKYQLRIDPTVSATGTLRFWYYPEYLFYSPSDSTPDWGEYAQGTYSGNLKIPTKFALAIRYYLLSKVFDEFLLRYEAEVQKLSSTRGDSHKDSSDYSFGGITNE